MRVLLTRPVDLAERSRDTLIAKGHEVDLAPTSKAIALNATIPSACNYIITSQNGVRFGLSKVKDKNCNLFVVGERAAVAARDLGFTPTLTEITAHALTAALLGGLADGKGPFIHLAGAHIAYNISAALLQDGIDATTVTVYEATPLPSNPDILSAIKSSNYDVVFFYSARAAIIFEDWLKEASMIDALRDTKAAVISQRVGDALTLPWKNVIVSEQPKENSLFDAVGL